jgi:phosphoribosylglycinamide formyltransferase 1
MKVLVLATDGLSTWMMVNSLLKDYPDLQVVIEQPVSRLKLLKRRMLRVGLWKVIGEILFMFYLLILRRLSRVHIRELIDDAGLSGKLPSGLFIQQYGSVNSEKCIAWLASQKPDVVVLNGTRIISPEVLSSCNALFLNTHCGITPAYRGVHGGYWALYNGDRKNVGVTVHQVDAGIDTGEIVYQEVITVDEWDNFLTYPIKQYIAGIPLMHRALADVEAGRLCNVRRNDLPSAVWLHPTLWQYVAGRWKRGVH